MWPLALVGATVAAVGGLIWYENSAKAATPATPPAPGQTPVWSLISAASVGQIQLPANATILVVVPSADPNSASITQYINNGAPAGVLGNVQGFPAGQTPPDSFGTGATRTVFTVGANPIAFNTDGQVQVYQITGFH